MSVTNEQTRNGESSRDFCLHLRAAAGQGLQTMEDMLCQLLTDAGYHLFSTHEYMSRLWGGNELGGLIAGVLGLLPESADLLYEARFKVTEVAARGRDAIRPGGAHGGRTRVPEGNAGMRRPPRDGA